MDKVEAVKILHRDIRTLKNDGYEDRDYEDEGEEALINPKHVQHFPEWHPKSIILPLFLLISLKLICKINYECMIWMLFL